MAIIHTHHNVYDTHYHIVFPVKYRRVLLDNRTSLAIVEIAREISERYDIDFEKIGADQDHIHLLVSFPPKYSGSEIVGMFKSITAKQIFRRFPEIRKNLWGGEFWSDGFYIATVSERGNWKTVERYVANQGKTKNSPQQLRLLA